MASLRKRGRVWYYRYSDADGLKHRSEGMPRPPRHGRAGPRRRIRGRQDQGRRHRSEGTGLPGSRRPPPGRTSRGIRELPANRGKPEACDGQGEPRPSRHRPGRPEKIRDLTLSRVSEALAALRRQDDLNQQTINHHITAVKCSSLALEGQPDPGARPGPPCHQQFRGGPPPCSPPPDPDRGRPSGGSDRDRPDRPGDDRP